MLPRKGIATSGGRPGVADRMDELQEMLPRKGIATVLPPHEDDIGPTVARDASPKGDCDLVMTPAVKQSMKELQEMLPRKGIATQATSLGILFL